MNLDTELRLMTALSGMQEFSPVMTPQIIMQVSEFELMPDMYITQIFDFGSAIACHVMAISVTSCVEEFSRWGTLHFCSCVGSIMALCYY